MSKKRGSVHLSISFIRNLVFALTLGWLVKSIWVTPPIEDYDANLAVAGLVIVAILYSVQFYREM